MFFAITDAVIFAVRCLFGAWMILAGQQSKTNRKLAFQMRPFALWRLYGPISGFRHRDEISSHAPLFDLYGRF